MLYTKKYGEILTNYIKPKSQNLYEIKSLISVLDIPLIIIFLLYIYFLNL